MNSVFVAALNQELHCTKQRKSTMAQGGNDSSSCPVCFDEFTESGHHLPRILPCSHTFCHKCIKTLLHRGLQIECPECKKKHPALQAEKSFPQNKYILENIRLRIRIGKLGHKEKKEKKDDLCQDHGEKLMFFCKDSACRKFICGLCLTKSHKQHDFVDKTEGQQIVKSENQKIKEGLLMEIEGKLHLQGKLRSSILSAQEEVNKKLTTSLKKLNEEKNAIVKKFDERIEKISKENQEANAQAEKLISDISSKTDLLRSVLETASQSENIQDISETLSEIISHIKLSKTVVAAVKCTETSGKELALAEMVEKALNEDLVQKQVTLMGKHAGE